MRDIALQSRLGIFNIILQFITFANINKLTVGFVGLLVGQLLVFVHFMSVIPYWRVFNVPAVSFLWCSARRDNYSLS